MYEKQFDRREKATKAGRSKLVGAAQKQVVDDMQGEICRKQSSLVDAAVTETRYVVCPSQHYAMFFYSQHGGDFKQG